MGYASIGDPYKSSFDGMDRSRSTVSGGLGINVGRYFIDLAMSQTNFNDTFTSYTFADGTGPTANIENRLTKTSLTFGLNF